MVGTIPSLPATLAALMSLSALVSEPASAQPPWQFLAECVGCHHLNGAGEPPEVPDLRADLYLVARVPEGRAYLAQVPGPAQAPFTDAELAMVLNWIIGELDEDAGEFEPYTAEEIAGYRGKVLMDPLRIRDEIWEKAGMNRATYGPGYWGAPD